jgi:transposase
MQNFAEKPKLHRNNLMEKHQIGIDVSKEKLNVALLIAPTFSKKKTKVVPNNTEGFRSLVEWVKRQINDQRSPSFIMEATGTYHQALALFLADHGLEICVVNPLMIKRFGESMAARTKTDAKDCVIIAHYGAKMNPKPWVPPSPQYRALQQLMSRLDQLDKMTRQEKNRLESLGPGPADQDVLDSIEKTLSYFDKEYKELSKKIQDHLDQHPDLKDDVKLLTSIPGIGKLTALRMTTALEGGSRFSSARQFAAYLGLSPRQNQSGNMTGKTTLSKMGPSALRKALYMPSVVACQCNPDINALYERLLKAGKTKMSALGAAMRKMAHLAFGVLKTRQTYRAFFSQILEPEAGGVFSIFKEQKASEF